MKILHVVTGLGKSSGVTTFVENVVDELRHLGHDVTIVTSEKVEELKGSKVSECDVIHIHGLWSPFLHRASAAAKRAGVPVIWSTHGMTAPWSLHHKWWKKWLPWYLYQKWDLKRAVFVHSTVEQEERWNFDLGFKRSVVAPLGTHLPDEVKVKGEGEQRKERVLLFVGRIYPVKAIDRLIESFSRVEMEKGRNWVLRIVGPDQAGHMEELTALCEKQGITYSMPKPPLDSTSLHFYTANNPCVQFAGPKFEAELDKEYWNCDCLALVSHTENFGATVVDAIAHYKPVITSTPTPWREVAERKCGWWVNNDVPTLARAIAEMMALSDEQRAEMGQRGRKLVEEKYTWEAVAKKLEWAYEQAANKCPLAPCVGCENYGDTCPIP